MQAEGTTFCKSLLIPQVWRKVYSVRYQMGGEEEAMDLFDSDEEKIDWSFARPAKKIN